MNDTENLRDGWVLQFCHGYSGPFLDCARQYAVLFKDTPYRVCTVYLTGEPRDDVISGSASDEVIFLNFSSREIRGLKLKAISALRKIAGSRDFRFCIAHRFKPTYIALLGTKLPVIGVQHALGVYKRRSRQVFANFFRNRLLLLGVSDAVRDDVRSCLSYWPLDRIETLYNRIDVESVQTELVSREDARNFLELPQDAWVVGNVGRLHPDKDQSILIEGFAEALPTLPDKSFLLIMGAGQLENHLRTLSERLGVEEKIIFAGQIPRGFRYFKAFNVFVLSSRNEGFGMVLAEAMAAGVPMIASNSGASREIVSDVGMLFTAGDKYSLAESLMAASRFSGEEEAARTRAAQLKLKDKFSDETAKSRFHEKILSKFPER